VARFVSTDSAGFLANFRRESKNLDPRHIFGDERQAHLRKVLRAHNRRQHVKVATISAGALAPALSASVKTQAALPLNPTDSRTEPQHLPIINFYWKASAALTFNKFLFNEGDGQCCSAAFGDDGGFNDKN